MIEFVRKRDGSVESFNQDKISTAIQKAMKAVNMIDDEIVLKVTKKALGKIKKEDENTARVDHIHEIVENSLMDMKLYEVAREYITYRNGNKPDIFRARVNYKPFEYPQLEEFTTAIQHSYWLVDEFNYNKDIQDFKVNTTEAERNVIKNTMLAISQIESYSVKTFWSKVYDRMPKPEIADVGATFSDSECFDDQTQVLTLKGWKYFKDVEESDQVAQYDIETGVIDFAKPISNIVKDYEGVMHHYLSKGTDICVTPNHEILVKHPQHNSFRKAKSSDGLWKGNYRYPSAGEYKSSIAREFNDLDRLLIAVQADGCLFGACPSGKGRKDFCMTVSKLRKIERIKLLLENCEIPYREIITDRDQTRFNAKLPSDVDVNQIKNFGWFDYSEVDCNWIEQFIEELSYWDCGINDKSIYYYNSNLEAIDKVQALATLANKTANKGMNRTAEQSIKNPAPHGPARKSSKDCYVVTISNQKQKVYCERKEVEYNGKVYCLEMPKGTLVTRRNKRVSIQGNCRHAQAYSKLLEYLGLNDEFRNVMDVPAIKNRVNYLKKFVAPKDCTDKEYMESILLFSLFVENVSLFSQFLIIMAFDNYKNMFTGMGNAVQSTSREEVVHALFGAELVNILREEHPEWFDEDLEKRIHENCLVSFEAEKEIIDWIFEKGSLDFINRLEVIEFIKDRYNKSMEDIGFSHVFDNVDHKVIEKFGWFDLQVNTTVHADFFSRRSVNYTKMTQTYDEDSLF